jgi:hypothetical protein
MARFAARGGIFYGKSRKISSLNQFSARTESAF